MSERLSALETACLDGLIDTRHGWRYRPAMGADSVRNLVIDGMTPPPGDPDDPFWLGAQWAYGQVRNALAAEAGSGSPTRSEP